MFFCAGTLTAFVRAKATKLGLVDVPNSRSSHHRPTPRGGGISFVLTSLVGLLTLLATHELTDKILLVLGLGGLVVAGIGLLDDRKSISPVLRLIVHFFVAIMAVHLIGGLSILRINDHLYRLGYLGDILAIVSIVWGLNLFNFMDGIDGLAGSEAVFVLGAGGMLGVLSGAPNSAWQPPMILAAACAGFLVWNWPPAKIFMGDVGSGYLGYSIVVLALLFARGHLEAFVAWIILAGVFFADATVTLIRRVTRGDRFLQAHRSHAYQRWARERQSHAFVTCWALIINVCWLLPCAIAAVLHPPLAVWFGCLAVVPLMILAHVSGAGRPE